MCGEENLWRRMVGSAVVQLTEATVYDVVQKKGGGGGDRDIARFYHSWDRDEEGVENGNGNPYH